MKSRSLILVALIAVVTTLILLKKSKSKNEPLVTSVPEVTTTESATPATPASQAQESQRQPASKGSTQEAVGHATVAPPAREQVGRLMPVDVRAIQRGLAGRYAKYRGREQLQLPNGTYEKLKLRAIPKSEYTGAESEIVAEKLGFVFVESTHASGRPAVLNRANGMIGMITGTILVRTTDIPAAQSLAQRLSLRVLHTDESIGMVFMAATPESAASFLNTIRGSPSVTSVSLEIVESEARF